MRRIAFALSYVVYLAAVVAAVDYLVFWRPFYARLSRGPAFGGVDAPRYVDRATMRRVGSLRADRKSSFPNFALEKPAGGIRVCAFGDSFTYGDEVADGHDFPALLQQVFLAQGLRNVEVLNFGNSWYGFHQAYMVWDALGRRFGCDFVLLGPDCFQPERDTTFNHSNLTFPYYLHGRYVLDGEGVRRVDVYGKTRQEGFAEYFKFVPHVRYLRYDRNPPAFLRAVLPEDSDLENPFYYYRGTAEAEAYETYTRLLRELTAERVGIVLLHSQPPIVELAKAVGKANLVATVAPRFERFPYHATGGHLSSFGNRWIADQYFALLTSGDYRPTLLDFEDLPQPPNGSAGQANVAPVSSYARIYLRLGERRVGFLAIASAIPGERRGKPEDLAGSDTVGLLALRREGKSFVDAAIVPTSVVPHEGDALVLSDGGNEVTIGTVHVIDPRAPVGIAVLAGLDFSGSLMLSSERLDVTHGAFSISMAGTPVLSGTPEGPRLSLQPLAGRLRNFRVYEGEYVDPDALGETGTVTMVLEGATGSVEMPVARWRKHAGDVLQVDHGLPERIAPANGAATVRAAPPLP